MSLISLTTNGYWAIADESRDVEVHTPFAVDTIEHSVHKTYLDTTGRHAITLTKARCTENHAQNVYVSLV